MFGSVKINVYEYILFLNLTMLKKNYSDVVFLIVVLKDEILL